MNERIERLKQQAYVTKDGEFCFDGGKVEILDVNLLVELIVKECANLCQCEWNGDADTHDSCEAYNECADMILEHFGVEE
jgi:hypothetical protein